MAKSNNVYIATGFAVLFLLLWLTTWILFAYNAVHPFMFTAFRINNKEYLDDMAYLADYISCKIYDLGIPISISCGSALGAARHGGPLAHDDDVDFFIKQKDGKQVETILRNDSNVAKVNLSKFGLQLTMKGRQSYCDIFFLSKVAGSNKWKFCGHPDRDWDYFTDDDWENLAKLPYGNNREAVQLRYPDTYLTRMFGPQWKTLVVVKPMHGSKKYPLYRGLDVVGVLKGKLRTI